MANYNKSFNFRNGVQVDEDDLIVRGSLVGIGTTIPRAELDVYGTVRSTGIITANNMYVVGIATFNDIQIGTGITIIGNSGTIAAKFYGDGAGLYNIPTSQWVDVDPAVFAPLPPPPGAGTGYTSIYAAGTVGIGTTIPRYYLQIGGVPTLNQTGVGIDSTGNVYISGILTSGFLVGSGAGITEVNASNISSGTLNNSRLPSDISISGILTAGTLSIVNGSINGIATIGFASITNAYIGVGTILTLSGTTATYNTGNFTSANISTGIVTTLIGTGLTYTTGNLTNAYIVSGVATNLSGSNLNYSGISTLGFATITNAYIGVSTFGSVSVTSGIFESINSINLNSSGISTVGFITASSSYLGFSTARAFQSGNIRVAPQFQPNLINTTEGNLTINSANGLTIVGDRFFSVGISTFEGEVTINTGIVPDTDESYIGTLTKRFSEAYIDNIQIGVSNPNKIETTSGDLILDSNSNRVVIDSNFNVTGVTTFTNSVQFGLSIEPSSNLNGTLGTNLNKFLSAYINDILIGVGVSNIITTATSDLVLDSATNKVNVDANLNVVGIATLSNKVTVGGNITPNQDNSISLGTTSLRFNEAYIDNIQIGINNNEINTSSGNLILNSNTNLVNISNDLRVGSKLNVVGIATFNSLILPPNDLGSGIGSSETSFLNAFINEVTIGVADTNKISTRSGDLILSGYEFANFVIIDNPLKVTGIATFSSDLLPVYDSSNSIGNFEKSFGQAFISDIQIGASGTTVINTRSGDLILDSSTGLVVINQDLNVQGSVNFLGNISFGGNSLVVDGLNSRVGIGSAIPETDFVVVGESIFYDNLNVGKTAGDRIILDGSSQTLTVKNLVVTGTSQGITASGAGITISSLNPPQTGTVSNLNFNQDFRLTSISSGTVAVNLSSGIGIGTVIGVGTNIGLNTESQLHVKGLLYVDGKVESDNFITAAGGFTSGIGTPIKIETDDINNTIILSANGIGTAIIPVYEGVTLVKSLWNSTDSGVNVLSNVGIGTTNPTAIVGASNTSILAVGVVTANKYYGDGSALTNLIGVGAGVQVRNNQNIVGTAGTVDFGSNLTVSAVSAGIVTVTVSGILSQWTTTNAGINTTANVGIGTTNPQTSLQVERYGVKTGFGTFSASSGVTADIDSFTISSTDFKTAEYTLHLINGSNIQSQKVLVMQNGTTAYSQEYAIMFEPNQIVSVGATVSSGVCKLQVTPETGISGLTTYRFTRQTML